MPAEPRRSQALLAAWVVAAFAVSATTDLRILGGAWAAALVLLHRGAGRALRRTLLVAAPFGFGLPAISWAWLAWRGGAPPAAPFLALSARATLVAFLTFSVLARADLLRALAPFPAASRILVVCLAQVHALRMLVAESGLGLRSRLPRRPRTGDVLRGSGAITATLLSLSVRNARDVADALRSRGFE